jgi:shikimate dehydrogenase
MKQAAPDMKMKFLPWDWKIDFNEFDLVVNTTPGDSAARFGNKVDAVSATFFEVLYNPWPTQLLMQWRKAGGYGIDGLDLLIHQAISQVEIFTLHTIDRDSVAKILRMVGERALS